MSIIAIHPRSGFAVNMGGQVRLKNAFTLVELLLALAISGLVGLTAVLILSSTIKSTDEVNDTRRAVLKRQVATVRLGSLIRGSSKVLSLNSNAIVLWTGDLTNDGKPSVSELRRLELNRSTKELWEFTAPSDLDGTLDVNFDLTADFEAITSNLQNSHFITGKLLLQHC